jgi:two-component system, chemotaxis family, sensor kinase CheA
VTFFSDDRANELRNLFFESAQELLQTLNEEGLALESNPNNPETIRTIRRTMHTLKGDSAACGYRELSDLAHALEDALTPEVAARAGSQLADLVLNSADTFDGILTAYREERQPPATDALRTMIETVANPNSEPAKAFAPKFDWNEYERLMIAANALPDQHIYNVALRIDPQCPMRTAALQLIRNIMQEVGTILAMHPEEESSETPDVVEVALATHHPQDWVAKKCKVPAVVSEIKVETSVIAPIATLPAPVATTSDADQDLLGLLPTQPPPVATPEAPTSAPTSAAPKSEPKSPTERHKSAAEKASSVAQTAQAMENMLRVEADRIDSVLDLVGELIIGKSMLMEILGAFGREFPKHPLRNQFMDAMAFQSQVLSKLQRSVMKIRMVPVEQLFRRFPRVLRDAARFEQKDVELVLHGEDTDLDKSILDALAEPLTHLVRNAVAHGIEKPEERKALGKPEKGTVLLNAYHQGNQVVIEIKDDGRGIDRAKVTAKAIEKGVITADELARLNDADALNLIFHAGFSTVDKVTEVAGRGVGMDVVKTVLERLKGTVTIQTELGKGTSFQLRLPLTLAIIKALLFRVRDRLYAVPLGNVLEITRAMEADIHIVDGHEVIQLREELLTLVRLSTMVEGTELQHRDKVFVIVVSVGHRKYGLVVDRLAGEQELVIKALDDMLISTELVSGASVLGDGRVVLILNISTVVERLGRHAKRAGVSA